MTINRTRRGTLAPDPEMWSALENGEKLHRILQEFYTHVYADDRLAHFFEGTTKQRAIEKQYLFLREIFTGEQVYIGNRPRNAHHWMVISDELFDYREALMERTLRRHALPERLIRRWRAVEEVFRKHIVKSAPHPRKIAGLEVPVSGVEETTLLVGSLCDHCSNEMTPGVLARFHVRTGKTYCQSCWPALERVASCESGAGRSGHADRHQVP